MKRLICALVAVLLVAAAVPSGGFTDLGDPAITRLWDGDQFICTGWYLSKMTVEKSYSPREGAWAKDWIDNRRGMSWIVSAGHCSDTDQVKRDEKKMVSGVVSWVSIMRSKPNTSHWFTELALGAVPDPREENEREYLKLADQNAAPGETVFIQGFPRGIERIIHGTVVDLKRPMLADTVLVRVPPGDWSVWNGMSGSPVLNTRSQVVGVMWGVSFAEDPTRLPLPFEVVEQSPDKIRWALITPVSRLKELLRLTGVHGYHE